jgi:hypothetical protein
LFRRSPRPLRLCGEIEFGFQRTPTTAWTSPQSSTRGHARRTAVRAVQTIQQPDRQKWAHARALEASSDFQSWSKVCRFRLPMRKDSPLQVKTSPDGLMKKKSRPA